jgi:hypothetical protein
MASKAYGREYKAQFTPVSEDKALEIYKYGADDRMPNTLLRHIMNSGVAMRAADKLKTYIVGLGFKEEQLIIDTATLDKMSSALSKFSGFSLHVKPLPNGMQKVDYIDFQCIRKTTDGKFKFNATIGQPKLDKEKWITYPKWPTTDQNGGIIYSYIDDGSHPHYPIPAYYAGIEDIRTSAELQKLDLEAVFNGFMPSAILTTIGKLDDINKDRYGYTEQDYFDQAVMRFTGQIKDRDGMSERRKLLVMNAATRDEVPSLQTFDAKAIIDASTVKRDEIGREVCRLFGVHPVLAGYSDASILGNTQSIANASKELNNHAKQFRDLITATLTRYWPNIDWEILEFQPYVVPDTALLQYMTQDEIRQMYLNLPPIERPVPNEGERILGILNGLSPLLATKVIDMIPKETLLSALGIDSGDQIQQAELAALFEPTIHAAKITPEMIAERYNDYYNAVNMTYSEFQRWSETECSRKAGVNRAPITRNLELLNINKPDWTEKHYRWAGQTIAFIERMRNVESGELIDGCDMSKRDISLKNWAYDVDK